MRSFDLSSTMTSAPGVVAFTVPGNPRGKGRPKFTRMKSGGVRTYTDAQTASYENLVSIAAYDALNGVSPFTTALKVTISVRLAPPASASKKVSAAMLAGEIHPAKKPDIDNVAKSILDGCNGIVFADDAQVVSLSIRKSYAEAAGVDVVIIPMG